MQRIFKLQGWNLKQGNYRRANWISIKCQGAKMYLTLVCLVPFYWILIWLVLRRWFISRCWYWWCWDKGDACLWNWHSWHYWDWSGKHFGILIFEFWFLKCFCYLGFEFWLFFSLGCDERQWHCYFGGKAFIFPRLLCYWSPWCGCCWTGNGCASSWFGLNFVSVVKMLIPHLIFSSSGHKRNCWWL